MVLWYCIAPKLHNDSRTGGKNAAVSMSVKPKVPCAIAKSADFRRCWKGYLVHSAETTENGWVNLCVWSSYFVC